MNNIEILEEYLKKLKLTPEELLKSDEIIKFIEYKEIQAIENLIKGYKELEEDNYVYHQLMQMQNKREYRSKFLKDFKAEYGENVMPDYDEIYNRYDKMKKQLENSIQKSKVKEIIYPTPKNPISFEVQTSEMYKKLEKLVEGE